MDRNTASTGLSTFSSMTGSADLIPVRGAAHRENRAPLIRFRVLPDFELWQHEPWLVRFSRQVDRNLGPPFETRGVPASPLARDRIADLPMWLPPDFPTGRQNPSPFRPIVASPSSPATCHCGSLVRVAFQQTRR